MIYPIIAIILGLIALVISADKFTLYAAKIAEHFGISPLIIGLTIVGFGTSAPEIIVSINAALENSGDIAIGNAMGSNLANMGLVVGVTALVLPMVNKWSGIRVELLILLMISILAGWCLSDSYLSRNDGIILLTSLFASLFSIVWFKRHFNGSDEDDAASDIPDGPETSNIATLCIYFILALAVLIGSANALVWGAKAVATALGVSELVIGLTIVAIGTSLPELAASLASALKNQHEIAIGNIIGSNIFNLGAVLGVAGVIKPFASSSSAFSRDYPAMMLILCLFTLLIFLPRVIKRNDIVIIGRFGGALLLVSYIAYNLILLKENIPQLLS